MRHDQHRSIGLNPQKDAGMEGCCINRRHGCGGCPTCGGICQKWGFCNTQHEGARRKCSLQETATRDVDDRDRFSVLLDGDHARSFAASLIAARMRWYVPQRQMLPDISSSMSASLG